MENGEISEVPLTTFDQDEPNECARYAKENLLLDEPGWKQYRNNQDNDYRETVGRMQWVSSVNRYDATRDVLATLMITTMNTNDSRHHKNGHARFL